MRRGLPGTALLTMVLGMPAAAQSALAHYALDAEPAWRVELPAALAEVSGLAVAEGGRVYLHGDEQATVFRFDLGTRRVVERFGLAGRAGLLHGDFEDIEVIGDRVFLVASDGGIYESRIGGDGRLVQATRRTRGLGAGCEVEGMAADPDGGALLLLCKQAKSKRWKDQVVVVAVSTETWQWEPKPRLLVAERDLAAATGAKRFNGSAIARHPRSGTFLLVAGPQRVFAEVDSSGRVLGGGKLDKSHRQPEGIAVAPDLTLLITDEGAGRAGTITGYAWRP